MYISRVQIKNVLCFAEIKISFDLGGNRPPWTMIVGDNATGKTALLKSIAIGLCDESSAAGLLKESEEGYIRRGAEEETKIIIDLRDKKKPKEKYSIKTKIEKIPIRKGRGKKDYIERVRQSTYPTSKDFPWGKIFACAYGAGRGTVGTGDIAGYSLINAVYNMFNYSEGLQNPELTIRRITKVSKHLSEQGVHAIVREIMPEEVRKFRMSDTGILVDGPGGDSMPLRDLADGYKSTFLWVTDFLGWTLSYNPEIIDSREISGIVLVDEIEQHLHPKWQRAIVHSLKKQFSKIQFITTTHSPLVASSIGELISEEGRDKLVHLALKDKNTVAKYEFKKHELESMKGLQWDQILASKAFDYQIGADPKVERILAEASELAGKGDKRSPEENERYQEFKNLLKKMMQPEGRDLPQREAQEELYQEMKNKIKELERKLFGN